MITFLTLFLLFSSTFATPLPDPAIPRIQVIPHKEDTEKPFDELRVIITRAANELSYDRFLYPPPSELLQSVYPTTRSPASMNNLLSSFQTGNADIEYSSTEGFIINAILPPEIELNHEIVQGTPVDNIPSPWGEQYYPGFMELFTRGVDMMLDVYRRISDVFDWTNYQRRKK